VIPSSIGWSDLGSFDSLYQEFPKDENGNSKNMEIEHISINSKDNLFLRMEIIKTGYCNS